IVEDSPTQAHFIGHLLRGQSFDVEFAGDGQQALAMIQAAPPEVVLTDLDMPRMNGLELVEAVRHSHPALPVGPMAAHGSEEIAALALRKGAASYVPKAYLEQDLPDTLRRVLALNEAARHQERALPFLAQTSYRFVLDNDPAPLASIIAYQDDLLARL